MTEWLRLWHQADYKNIKYLNGVEESSLQYDYYVLDQSDSESECKERHARLKNVLLVTGPVGVWTAYSSSTALLVGCLGY